MKEETIRNHVVEILRKHPATRKDDNVWVFMVLVKLGFGKIRNDEMKIDLKKFEDFPAFESITRARRNLQNTEGLYEAEEEVIEKRKEKQSIYKNRYSPKSKYSNADSFGNSQLSQWK